MKIQQAKFILSSFRPNGQDAKDPDFAEALALAAEDRELGEWLARERAQDATFSSALSSVELPEELREEILAALDQDPSGLEDPELDSAFFSAFADMQAPEDLRDQILVAMDQETKVAQGAFPVWKVLPYAAAAVVVLCLTLVFLPNDKDDPGTIAGGAGQIDTPEEIFEARDIQQSVGRRLVKDGVQFVSNSAEESIEWLKAKQLPVVDIPEKLKNMKCIGCTEIVLKGDVHGSLVRFMSADGKEVNMLVIAEKDVKNVNDLPICKVTAERDAYYCPKCEYWVARMHTKDAVVILLSQLDKEQTAGIF